MATLAHPDEPRRPNIASADIQLPAVTSYEQVDDEILAIDPPVAPSCPPGIKLIARRDRTRQKSPPLKVDWDDTDTASQE